MKFCQSYIYNTIFLGLYMFISYFCNLCEKYSLAYLNADAWNIAIMLVIENADKVSIARCIFVAMKTMLHFWFSFL